MNWEALGAIGELVGGLVVLVTIIYLSIQVRQSAQATRCSTEIQITQMISDWTSAKSIDARYQRIYDELAQGKELSNDDKIYFTWSTSAICAIADGAMDQYKAGLISERCWMTLERIIVGLLTLEFQSHWWQQRDGGFSPELYEFIDSRKSSVNWSLGSSRTWLDREDTGSQQS